MYANEADEALFQKFLTKSAREYCKHGHPWVEENLRLQFSKRNQIYCIVCKRERARKYRNRQYKIGYTHPYLKKYGITGTQFDSMVLVAEGRCAICIQPSKDLHVDHDHMCCPPRQSCGKCIRGLLCSECNHLLGKAQDSVDVLKSAINYLEKF